MSVKIKKNAISINVNGEMTPIGMIGDGVENLETIIAVNDDRTSDYTKLHIDVSDGVAHKALEQTDIADNLTTNDANKVLSAKQGMQLKQDLTQLGNLQIPESTVQNAVNNYVNANSGGFATKTELSESVTEIKDEMKSFYSVKYLFKNNSIKIPYKTGERYISKIIELDLIPNKKYYFNIGTIVDGVNVRIICYKGNEIVLSSYLGSGESGTLTIPSETTKAELSLNALTNTYATKDGIAKFNDIFVLDLENFSKEFALDNNTGIDAKGYKIPYSGRNTAYFFKDSVDVLRASSSEYCYAYVYETDDFSSYANERYEIPYGKITTISGKYICLYFTGTINGSTKVNYSEQLFFDATSLNPLVPTTNSQGIRFMWVTDTHATYRKPIVTDSLDRLKKDMKFCADNLLFDFVLHGGDLIEQEYYSASSDKDALRLMSKELVDFSKYGNLKFVVGNHDGLEANKNFTNTVLYSIGYNYENKGKPYYYFDYGTIGIRFIVLANPDDNFFGISKEQFEWLINALDTNYNVVIATHMTSLSNMYNNDRLADVINSFCNKTSGSGTLYSGEIISWDFTSGANGKVLVVLGGHTHEDKVLQPHTDKNLYDCPIVVLRKGCYTSELSDVAYTDKSYGYDLCYLNITDGKLYLYRRGNGLNRIVDLNI